MTNLTYNQRNRIFRHAEEAFKALVLIQPESVHGALPEYEIFVRDVGNALDPERPGLFYKGFPPEKAIKCAIERFYPKCMPDPCLKLRDGSPYNSGTHIDAYGRSIFPAIQRHLDALWDARLELAKIETLEEARNRKYEKAK